LFFGNCSYSLTRRNKLRAKAFPLDVPRYKEELGKDIFDPMLLSPLCHHARQAGKAKSFLLKISNIS
jgi:hypothetical protein